MRRVFWKALEGSGEAVCPMNLYVRNVHMAVADYRALLLPLCLFPCRFFSALKDPERRSAFLPCLMFPPGLQWPSVSSTQQSGDRVLES